jgi:hypothetical protein
MGIYAYALVEDEDVSNAVDRMLDAKPEPEPPKVSQETRRQVGRIHYSTGKGKKKCGTA